MLSQSLEVESVPTRQSIVSLLITTIIPVFIVLVLGLVSTKEIEAKICRVLYFLDVLVYP